MDRFLPMANIGKLTVILGVQKMSFRVYENGIENRKYSFWGGNKVLGDDGQIPFLCLWLARKALREDMPHGLNSVFSCCFR